MLITNKYKARVPARPEEIEGHGREVLAHSNPREEMWALPMASSLFLPLSTQTFKLRSSLSKPFILRSSQSYTSLANPLQVS